VLVALAMTLAASWVSVIGMFVASIQSFEENERIDVW